MLQYLVVVILLLASCGGKQEAVSAPHVNMASEPAEASWLERFQTAARSDNPANALAIFEQLQTEHAELLSSDNLLTMAVYAVEIARSIELTQPILDYAMATYPTDIGKFGGIDAALFRLMHPDSDATTKG